jgi:hypothetical protein
MSELLFLDSYIKYIKRALIITTQDLEERN